MSNNKSAKEKRKTIKALLNSPGGHVLLEELKRITGYGQDLYLKGMSELDLAHAAGRQSVGNHIIRILNREE